MTKEQLNKQFDYILSCINNDDETLHTPAEKLSYFKECFNVEFNYTYNERRYPSLQDRIASYLRGLPSCCSVTFSDYEITQIGKSWGFCKTEKAETMFCKNWWNALAFRILQLCKRHGIVL